MSAPQNVAEVRRLVGMVNQLSKFIRNCADLLHPLTVLLSKKNVWAWGPSQEEAFTTLKDKLSKLTTLTLYNSKYQALCRLWSRHSFAAKDKQ